MILNNNEGITEDDLDLLEKTKQTKRIIFINKDDLPSKFDESKLEGENVIYGNTMSENGLENLKTG